MNTNIIHSDTMQPVTDRLDLTPGYSAPKLISSTPAARLYSLRSAGKTLCIKTPATDSGLLIDLLKREYAIGVSLSHPGIVDYLRWESSSPVGPGIIMEYVDGCPLDSWLAEHPSLAARHRIFEQLLDVVEYLHHHGILHNDLKPSNILVSRVSRSIKLIDFGFADDDANTLQRTMGGTRGYASPELLSGNRNTDVRSDIYSLGVLMRDIYGRRFARIARRCRNSDPARRYASVAELRKAWLRRRQMPHRSFITALVALTLLSIGWGISRHSRSVKAIEQASAMSAQLRDSVDVLNARLTDIDMHEALNARLLDEYQQAVDRLADAMADSMRAVTDYVSLCQVLGHAQTNIISLNDDFCRLHPHDGPDIIALYSHAMGERLFTAIKPVFDSREASLR